MKQLQILHLVRHSPYQPISGARIRNGQTINALRQLGDVTIFCVCNDIFTPTQPLPEHHNYHAQRITFSPATIMRFGAQCLRKKNMLVTDLLHSPAVEQRLHDVIQRIQPDIIVLSEPWLFRYLEAVQSHDAIKIFDMHNVESDLYEDICHASPLNLRLLRNKLLLRTARSVERQCIAMADMLWTCSKNDADRVAELAPDTPCHVVPNTININRYGSIKPFSATEPLPKHILFCGTFSYAPNVLAAERLITNILPRIREVHPSVELTLVGNSPTATMRRAARRNSHIHVTGAVPDIRPFLQHAGVVVSPLTVGGGTRLKILEAFAANRPVVATKKAAEGLDVTHGKHLLIGESDIALAHHAATLLSQSALCKSITKEAYLLTAKQYSDLAGCEAIFNALGSPLQQPSVATAKSYA